MDDVLTIRVEILKEMGGGRSEGEVKGQGVQIIGVVHGV